jgi:hypothetical protein
MCQTHFRLGKSDALKVVSQTRVLITNPGLQQRNFVRDRTQRNLQYAVWWFAAYGSSFAVQVVRATPSEKGLRNRNSFVRTTDRTTPLSLKLGVVSESDWGRRKEAG